MQLFFFFRRAPKNSQTQKGGGKGKGAGERSKERGEGVVRGRVLCGGHCGCVRQPTSYISLYTQTTAEGPKLATATLFLFLCLTLSLSHSLCLPPSCCCCFTASLGRFSGKVSCFTFSLWLSWFYLQLNKMPSTVLNANFQRCMRFATAPPSGHTPPFHDPSVHDHLAQMRLANDYALCLLA